ncbi:hypothetical protein [uncultured Clostridium sp.]|jgi:hypothetical protein|uniref:hypothetical protein n=1 Tax=uncultured Clostridium sp. TaxID=59620 RepID=UPI002606D3B6|nr:hypothetical protein [uncultured Clostridium sp.]
MNLKTNIISNENIYPENPIYFKELEFAEFLELENTDPDIDSVNSIKIWPEVEDIQVIKTEIGISNEGQKLTGTKLIIIVKINEKITYSGVSTDEPVHIIYNEVYKSLFIIVPENLKKLDIKALIRANRVFIAPYVQTVYARKFSCRKIYKATSIFIEARIC